MKITSNVKPAPQSINLVLEVSKDELKEIFADDLNSLRLELDDWLEKNGHDPYYDDFTISSMKIVKNKLIVNAKVIL